jgi:hypothetical protein
LLISAKANPDRIDVWPRGVDTTLFSPARRAPALREEWHVSALIHHTMLLPCVVLATVERQSRKVASCVDLYRGRRADTTRVPSRDHVDM